MKYLFVPLRQRREHSHTRLRMASPAQGLATARDFFISQTALDTYRKMCPPALAAAWLGGLHAERLASPKPQAIGNLSGCASTFRGICSGLSADALGLAQFPECVATLAIAEGERPFCPD